MCLCGPFDLLFDFYNNKLEIIVYRIASKFHFATENRSQLVLCNLISMSFIISTPSWIFSWCRFVFFKYNWRILDFRYLLHAAKLRMLHYITVKFDWAFSCNAHARFLWPQGNRVIFAICVLFSKDKKD